MGREIVMQLGQHLLMGYGRVSLVCNVSCHHNVSLASNTQATIDTHSISPLMPPQDTRVTRLVDTTDISLLPSLNPDGFDRATEVRCYSVHTQ